MVLLLAPVLVRNANKKKYSADGTTGRVETGLADVLFAKLWTAQRNWKTATTSLCLHQALGGEAHV